MERKILFTMRLNKNERLLIKALANRLERSQSDALRFLVRVAAEELNVTNCMSNIQPKGTCDDNERADG